jgi:hypothetical protein
MRSSPELPRPGFRAAASLLMVPAAGQPEKRPVCEAAPQYAVRDGRAGHVILLNPMKASHGEGKMYQVWRPDGDGQSLASTIKQSPSVKPSACPVADSPSRAAKACPLRARTDEPPRIVTVSHGHRVSDPPVSRGTSMARNRLTASALPPAHGRRWPERSVPAICPPARTVRVNHGHSPKIKRIGAGHATRRPPRLGHRLPKLMVRGLAKDSPRDL